MSSLYSIHCHIKNFQYYNIANGFRYRTEKLTNYKNAKQITDNINTSVEFESFFYDAVIFANSIVKNDKVIEWLNRNNYNTILTFGLQQLDFVKKIVLQANLGSALSVNYEYWSVLIYYVLALRKAPDEIYQFDYKNKFVSAVLASNTDSKTNEEFNRTALLLKVANNGVYTYLRLLFSSNIILNGDSLNVRQLKRWNSYDISKIKEFFLCFNYLMTTNYDLLLEKITSKNIYHLHGSFSRNPKRVLYESLGVIYNAKKYDLSTIVIGDYFLAKSFYQVAAKVASNNKINTKIDAYDDMMKEAIRIGNTDVVVVFGLGIDNDYHILRSIQIEMVQNKCNNPNIIYCYYSDQDRNDFINLYKKKSYINHVAFLINTLPAELSNHILDKVSVSIIDSKEIIKNLFVSTEK